MLDNAPVIRSTVDGLTIEGWSRAAVQTYWRIAELKVLFDLGLQPWDFMGAPTCLISHAHLDHIAALPVYVARRRMMKMEPPVIYLPEEAIPAAQMMLRTFTRLDRGRMPCELIGVQAGDEVELSRELIVDVIQTTHSVPSVGYIINERRRKLKPEYQNLQGHEIRDLRLSGVEVTRETRVPLVGFTGDTNPKGWDDNPTLFDVKVLITEMTFIAKSHRKEKIHKHGHTHLDDWLERLDRFRNTTVIASHFSTRYSNQQITKLVQKRIPDMLGGRLKLWL
jgi:ribonuclease Z